jgi:hypothetical protein
MVLGWGVALVVAVAAWMIFGGKSPSSAEAQDSTPGYTPTVTPSSSHTPGAAVAPIVVSPSKAIPSGLVPSKSGPPDDYQIMAKMSNLSGAQLQKFDKACYDREAVLAYWANAGGKKMEEAKAALKEAKANNADEKTINEIQGKNDLLIEIENEMRTALRANVMAELTLEQQRRWGGVVLNRELLKRLGRVELSEKQREFVRQMTDDAADRLVKPGMVEKDPFMMALRENAVLDPLVRQARDKVLTIDQRARVADPGKVIIR